MCGRFTLRAPMTVLAEQFLFDLGPLAKEAFRPRYNIAPTQEVPAVRLVDGKRQLAMLHFGLIPSWSENATLKFNTINACADPKSPAASAPGVLPYAGGFFVRSW